MGNRISCIFFGIIVGATVVDGPVSVEAASYSARVAVSDSSRIPVKVLEKRRTALLALLEPGIALVRSADRMREDEHPQASDFRQNNGFYYLTGLETPGSWLVMTKGRDGSEKVFLYVPQRNPSTEIWTGPQPGMGEVKERTGIALVKPVEDFQVNVVERMLGPGLGDAYPRVYLNFSAGRDHARKIVDAALENGRAISDLGGALAKLRLVKDSVEVARLRRAIAITAEAQREAMRAARPEMYEYELEAVVEYVFRSRGAERVGFPTVVGSGPNNVVFHHDKNRRQMKKGDLVVIDAGAEFGYYTADITRTFPVSGKFTSRQRKIYELVLATQQVVIDSVRPGMTIWDLERVARRYMRDQSKGLCRGGCDRYFLHGLSHWLGMDVHDVGDYETPLQPGMVLTIEPGIYLEEEGLGVRIEDDVLVTKEGHEVLSSDAPRTVAEIESLMEEEPQACPCRP